MEDTSPKPIGLDDIKTEVLQIITNRSEQSQKNSKKGKFKGWVTCARILHDIGQSTNDKPGRVMTLAELFEVLYELLSSGVIIAWEHNYRRTGANAYFKRFRPAPSESNEK